jgi:hypothetical protein
MNLLCPNCQKMLTVPEQYAGQLMKCPLCSGNFTVPTVSAGATPAAVAAPAPPLAPPPAPPPATAPATPEPSSVAALPTPVPSPPPPDEPDVYGLRVEAPAPAPAPEPVVVSTPAPSPLPPVTDPHTITTPPAAPPSTPPQGHEHTKLLVLDTKVLQWIAPAGVVLIFLLFFFTWVGVYPGNVKSAVTQMGWGAAFGLVSVDTGMEKHYKRPADAKPITEVGPGPSVLAIFYVLFFLIVVLPLTVGSILLNYMQVKLPPGIEALLPWRWGIVSAVNIVAFLFLILQVGLGFSLENDYRSNVEKWDYKKEYQQFADDSLRIAIEKGKDLQAASTTLVLRFVLFLQIVVILAALLMYWMERRGPNKAPPGLELRW